MAINLRLASDTSRASGNMHPIIQPGTIEVGMYTDIEDTVSYALTSFCELDSGRMVLSDFVVKQVWREENGKNALYLVDETGKDLVEIEELKVGLASLGDFYRLAHLIKSQHEL
jgi:hypothetical protein